ncbi:ABC transporter ATP-binding protein [Microbispora amethystogenes]|uniref:Multidrug ABC transporter ATP-binding protein n=1 Tax=Microbispora amethystogenes TaxID=1427754 RepID=A0ABQ4FMP9_9ACTN|nr:ABC transporter ATP-binding protein [Microbispora amethystogenes]GIH36104.1 multidrug ABC transporter ATP-binding protein [Microbispora amethystogenes]
MAAIQVNHLSKSYGSFQAVDDISFEVEAGAVFALLGRNGAGKTTTIELLTGFRRPDAGTVRVLGLDPIRDRAQVRGNVGIMLQEAGFFPDLTAGQTVEIWRDFTPAARPASEALELAGLTAKAKTKVRQLSGGEKRRLDLALALLGRPDVLFLDEPTTGMDPEARRDVWEVVRDLAARGTTVLLTTHYLEEAQQLATNLAIMDRGEIVVGGDMAETLAARVGRVSFELPSVVQPGELPLPATVRGKVAVVQAADPDLAAQTLLSWASERGLRLRGLEVRTASLEDLFLELAHNGETAQNSTTTRDARA